jgi:two-component system, chemotaxis family, protein-glutamate methylesterase/glutaminase
MLDELLTAAGPLRATFASEGEPLKKAHIYIAPADRHLLVSDDCVVLGAGSRENHTRPAVDPMMRSVALCCGHRAIGVVLTGMLGDGASGLQAIAQCGGITIVQDPLDALYSSMPDSAIEKIAPDHIARLTDVPALLNSLARQPAGEPSVVPETLRFEVEMAKGRSAEMVDMDQLGRRSVLTCPECHGVMWEIEEGDLIRYRCHVGHAYTAELMSLALDENLRNALGSSLRALEERVSLLERMERKARGAGQERLARNWAEKLEENTRDLQIIRTAIRQIERVDKET